MIELLQDDVYFDATFNTLLQATTLHQTTEEGLRRTIELARSLFHLFSQLRRELIGRNDPRTQ